METSPLTNKCEFIETSPSKIVRPEVYIFPPKDASRPTNSSEFIETSPSTYTREFTDKSLPINNEPAILLVV